MLRIQQSRIIADRDKYKSQVAVYELVEENLKPLKTDSILFKYEPDYKRYILAFEVEFNINQFEIAPNKIRNYSSTITRIDQAGEKLMDVVRSLAEQRAQKQSMEDVSYSLIIAGYSSKLLNPDQDHDYMLSYKRAYNLWEYWMNSGINFESEKYEGLIDLHIAGNGWGGVGRFEWDPHKQFQSEVKNQRFIIQITPKVLDVL